MRELLMDAAAILLRLVSRKHLYVWKKQGFVTVTTCRHGDNKCFRSDDTTRRGKSRPREKQKKANP